MSTPETALTEQEALARLMRLLDEAYAHYREHPENDNVETMEGSVTVSYGYNHTRSRRSTSSNRPIIESVSIYSRVFALREKGWGSTHTFPSVREALAAVEVAHAAEMATDWAKRHADGWKDYTIEELP